MIPTSNVEYNGSKTQVSPNGSTINYYNVLSRRFDTSQSNQIGDFKNPTPYSFTVLDRSSYVGIDRTFEANDYQGPYTTVFGTTSSVPDSVFNLAPSREDAYNLALTRFFDILRGSLDLSVDIAEFSQTKQLFNLFDPSRLKDLAKFLSIAKRTGFTPKGLFDNLIGDHSLVNYFGGRKLTPAGRDLRDKALQRAREALRAELALAGLTAQMLANAWLEWTYGWRPLMQTMYDINSQLAFNKVPELLRVSASSRLPYPRRVNRVSSIGIAGGVTNSFNEQVKFTSSSKVGCRIECSILPRDSNLNLAEWTSLNPATIAWELVPYSFVVDWFIEVGDWLRNLESLYIYKNRISNVVITDLNAATAQIVVNDKQSGFGRSKTIQYGAYVKQISFNRAVGSALPVPYKPRITMDLGWRRYVTAAALLTQLIK